MINIAYSRVFFSFQLKHSQETVMGAWERRLPTTITSCKKLALPCAPKVAYSTYEILTIG